MTNAPVTNASAAQTAPKKPMSKRRKKTIRNLIILGVVLVVIIVVSVLLSNGNASKVTIQNEIVPLTRGNLSKSVTGTGSLALSNSNSFTLPEGVKIDEVALKTGARVSEGDVIATLDADSLNAKIIELQSSVDTGNKSLSQYSGDTATSYISSKVSGRVKIIYVEKGDDIKTVMVEKSALMVVSVDGKMKINLTVGSTEGLTLNDEVTVTLKNSAKKTGTISSFGADGKSCVILLDDKVPTPGEEATVTYDGKELGKGTLEINHPQYITGNVGTCKSIPVSLNQKIYNGTTLIRLKNLPISSEYESKLAEVSELVEQLNQAIEYRAKGNALVSPYDGILGALELQNGQAIGENTSLSVSDTGSMTLDVSVDELDILNVKEGMAVKIEIDALEDETFEGEVTFISASGTTENSVTKYPVSINVKSDDRLLPGMSATADIVIEEKKDVLLVPQNALITRQGKTFVMISKGVPSQAEGETAGVMTEIKTGLSDDTYAEVLSGLSDSDQVIVVRSGSSDNGNMMFQMGGMGGGMAIRGEGAPPAGGTQRGQQGGGDGPTFDRQG